jgi:hypothetical protein
MSELFDKRKLFTECYVKLLQKMMDDGKTPLIMKDGLKHMKNSLHYDGLAQDVDLFDGTKYLSSTEDHRPYGLFWESLHPDCYWGGNGLKEDGLKNDGNHYSVTMGGRK